MVKNNVRSIKKRQWYVQGLWEPFREKVEMQCPKMYDEAKKWALKVEKYSKNNDYVVKKPPTDISEESSAAKPDVEDLTAAFELTKVINDLKESKLSVNRQNQRSNDSTQNHNNNTWSENNRFHRYYECNQPGHILKDCPNRSLQLQSHNQWSTARKNQLVGSEVVEGKSLFDIRNLGKRRRIKEEHEMP
ncbi:1614_t:CDS:2, partial [Gigaspora margarita]